MWAKKEILNASLRHNGPHRDVFIQPHIERFLLYPLPRHWKSLMSDSEITCVNELVGDNATMRCSTIHSELTGVPEVLRWKTRRNPRHFVVEPSTSLGSSSALSSNFTGFLPSWRQMIP